MDAEVANMIRRAWPNVREMLHRRGYNAYESMAEEAPVKRATTQGHQCYTVVPMEQQEIDRAREKALALGQRFARVNRPRGPLMVVFTSDARVNVDAVRWIVRCMDADGCNVRHAILMARQKHTSQVPIKIAETAKGRYRIELATYEQFFYCPVDNWLVPEHDILSPEQKAALLDRLCLTPETSHRMPRQLRTDVVSLYYGIEPGTVIRYRCHLGDLEPFDYYRIIVVSETRDA